VLPNSRRADAEDSGSRARTQENLGGAFGRLEFGPLLLTVNASSVETIPMDLDGEGDQRARYAARL
jgi:hypothetical protein